MFLLMIALLIFIKSLVLECEIMSSKKNEIINVRVDSDVKTDSRIILEKKSLSHSKAFRMLLEHIIEVGDVPQFMKKEV